ncbi:dTDP-4-dehydrorhamnose 3,5-epimerase [Candidatus Pelagibacter sp.]|nr:dTDP-4-dehydrorhamnose 3,5-epimerase [Candidatus Pelagibacter sp.]
MKIIKNQFKGLLVIENQRFIDRRGFFREILLEKKLKKKFPFNVISSSKKNVIRGLHYQVNKPQGKFISVAKGKILDVAVDLRKKSKTFGKHFKIILSDKNCKSIYIPEGFAHGFSCLSKENIIIYSCTNYRNKKGERGILWNDEMLGIDWKIKKPIISKKDKKNPKLKDIF